MLAFERLVTSTRGRAQSESPGDPCAETELLDSSHALKRETERRLRRLALRPRGSRHGTSLGRRQGQHADAQLKGSVGTELTSPAVAGRSILRLERLGGLGDSPRLPRRGASENQDDPAG